MTHYQQAKDNSSDSQYEEEQCTALAIHLGPDENGAYTQCICLAQPDHRHRDINGNMWITYAKLVSKKEN